VRLAVLAGQLGPVVAGGWAVPVGVASRVPNRQFARRGPFLCVESMVPMKPVCKFLTHASSLEEVTLICMTHEESGLAQKLEVA